MCERCEFKCAFCGRTISFNEMDDETGHIFCPKIWNEKQNTAVPSTCRVNFEARQIRHKEAGGGL